MQEWACEWFLRSIQPSYMGIKHQLASTKFVALQRMAGTIVTWFHGLKKKRIKVGTETSQVNPTALSPSLLSICTHSRFQLHGRPLCKYDKLCLNTQLLFVDCVASCSYLSFTTNTSIWDKNKYLTTVPQWIQVDFNCSPLWSAKICNT